MNQINYKINRLGPEVIVLAMDGKESVGRLDGVIRTKNNSAIEYLLVESPYRNQGVGKNLIQLFLKECPLNSTIDVTVRSIESVPIEELEKFYLKCGFSIINKSINMQTRKNKNAHSEETCNL